MKLYVHIGQPKTGTSAIQGFLNYNRRALAKKRKILYPNFDNDKLDTGLLHNHASFFMQAQKRKDYSRCVKKFTKCVNFCRKNEIDKIVISNEGWRWKWWPEILRKIFEATGLDYEFVLYLRRQDKYLEAAWKQWGHKIPGCDSIQDYAKQLELNWHRVLGMWTEHFDADRFIVRPYEKAQIGDDIVKDFSKIIGLKDPSDFDPPPSTNININAGLSRELVEVLRLCKNLVAGVNDHSVIDFLNDMLSDSHRKKPMDAYAFLSPQERADIVEKYTPLNDRIAAKFLGQPDARLFLEPLPDLDQKWEPPADLTVEKVVPLFMEIMLKQQKQIQELTSEMTR